MSEDNKLAAIPPNHTLEVPPFGRSPALILPMNNIREAESRFIEAKTVNPSTYSDLEHTFNESYRDLKKHLAAIQFAKNLADKAIREAKANVILGIYADHMKGKPKYQDNADLRDAFLIKDPDYLAALDRRDQLAALESNFEGKIKVVENVCRYMRQKMYLISKNGAIDSNVYITSGR